MDFYPKAAMERAMKIQEVLLRAMARKITWFEAAEILGFSDRLCSPEVHGASALKKPRTPFIYILQSLAANLR
jgi:hypothetical protein